MKRTDLVNGLPPSLADALARLQNGDFPPIEPPTYICDMCEDLGVIKVAGLNPGDPGFGQLIPCPNPDCPKGNESRRVMWQRRYDKAGLLDDYRDYSFETFDKLTDKETDKKLIARFAAGLFCTTPDRYFSEREIYKAMGIDAPGDAKGQRKNCIVFTGEPGMGKTCMVAAICKYELERGRPMLFIRALDLIKSIQSRYGVTEPPTAEDVIKDFQTAPLLAIDEMTIYNSDKADRLEKIEDIIRYRTGQNLPTLITTNHNQTEFERAWGIRTADVLDNKAHWIEMSGDKLRKTRKALGGV